MNSALTTFAECDVPLLSTAEATKRIVRMTVATTADAGGDRLPLNLCLALDKSSSMSGPKLETLKQAAILLLDRLRERDMVSILAFDGKCELVAPTTTLFAAQKRDLAERIAAIRPGYGTALLEAYLRSAGLVADHLLKQGVNEVILVTDGRANRPAHPDPDQLREHAGKLNKLGVQTSVYGIGEDIKPYYLVPLAVYGGGTYSYLPHVDAAMFEARESHLFNIVARATTVQITVPTGASLRVLGDIPHRVRGRHLTLYVGNLSRGQQAVFYIEMVTPTNGEGITVPWTARTTYLDNSGDEQTAEIVCPFRYVEHTLAKSAPRDMSVRQDASLVRVGYAIHKALILADSGRRREAGAALHGSVAHIKYLTPDQIQELNSLAARIESHSLGKAEYQSHYYQAYQRQEPRRLRVQVDPVPPKAVTIAARCQRSGAPFDMLCEMRSPDTWVIYGAVAVTEVGEHCEGVAPIKIHGTFDLEPYPGCPHCHNSRFFRCGCGKVVCWDGATMQVTCPWCGNSGSMGSEPLRSLEAIDDHGANREYAVRSESRADREYHRREKRHEKMGS